MLIFLFGAKLDSGPLYDIKIKSQRIFNDESRRLICFKDSTTFGDNNVKKYCEVK